MKIRTFGVIGTGNMGSAIIKGVLSKHLIKPSQVLIYDVISGKSKKLARELKVRSARNLYEVIRNSDVILLAVKPQNLPETALQFKKAMVKNKQIISILAGVSIKTIKKNFGSNVRVVRAMPNLGAMVGHSMTAITGDQSLIPFARKVFRSCGEVMLLNEKYFHAVTALSGSGPAYFFFLMELAMITALDMGFSRRDAVLLAKQTAKGAALLAAFSELNPEELRKQVTSKGGTTEAAMKVLKSKKWKNSFTLAIRAAMKRGEQLGKAVE